MCLRWSTRRSPSRRRSGELVYIFIYVGEERGGEKRGERDGRKEKKKKKHLEKILTLFLKSLFFKTSKKPKNFSFFF